MIRVTVFIIAVCFSIPVVSSEKGLVDLMNRHYEKEEYYAAITEAMRYQHLYPDGKLYPASMLVMGKSYYLGGDRKRGLNILGECYNRFHKTPEGESALFYSSLMRLQSGSYYYAARGFNEYGYVYQNGIFREDSIINLSIIYALAENYDKAEKKLEEYHTLYPDGKFISRADGLLRLYREGSERPEKSLFIAGLSSAIIPGSGYFYTENYLLGILSMATNGALIYGIYDGYRKKDRYQMFFFSVIEFSFYNYSLFGSVRSADEYNRNSALKKELVTGIKGYF